MGGAVKTGNKAGMAADELNVGIVISYRYSDLVVCSARHESGVADGKRNFPGEGHAGGHADHILFGDANFKKSLGVFIAEIVGADRFIDIGAQNHNVLIRLAELC